jgi:hypothetical protein
MFEPKALVAYLGLLHELNTIICMNVPVKELKSTWTHTLSHNKNKKDHPAN